MSVNGKFPLDDHNFFNYTSTQYSDWWYLLELPLTYVPYVTAAGSYGYYGGIFLCPLNSGYFSPGWQNGAITGQVLFRPLLSYGYNWAGVCQEVQPGGELTGLGGFSNGQPTPESAVVAPSDLIAFGDGFSRSRNARYDGWMTETLIMPFVHGFGEWPGFINPRNQPGFISHHGRANRAFVDGHLESEDMRKTFQATDDQLRRWNVDNKPHHDSLTD
jgi:prepilin-type processing-associated H-X9-DG protein